MQYENRSDRALFVDLVVGHNLKHIMNIADTLCLDGSQISSHHSWFSRAPRNAICIASRFPTAYPCGNNEMKKEREKNIRICTKFILI